MTFLPSLRSFGIRQLLELGLELGAPVLLVVELRLDQVPHLGVDLGGQHLVGLGELRLGPAVLPVGVDDRPERGDPAAGLRGRGLIAGGVQIGELGFELLQLRLQVDQALEHAVQATRTVRWAFLSNIDVSRTFRGRIAPWETWTKLQSGS